MKLDRSNGVGKYAIVKMRAIGDMADPEKQARAEAAIETLSALRVLEFGEPETAEEFFVIRLRDKYAAKALSAYASAARKDDAQYATDVAELAIRAGANSRFCKVPD